MKVPLAAHRLIQNGEQYLEVWANGERLIVPAPFMPYYYMHDDPRTWPRPPSGIVRVYRQDIRPLSNPTKTETWHKVEVKNVEFVNESHAYENGNPVGRFGENHLGFVERVLIDMPDFYHRFPNTRPLRLMTLDIEQLSKGDGFPTENDPLLAIAWSCDVEGEPETEPICVINDDPDLKSDRSLLTEFLNAIEAFDPDVLVGYNIHGYDLQMLMKRLKKNSLSTAKLGRMSKEPYVNKGFNGKEEVVLSGRLVYDVYEPVKLDQTMFGIKDRKLKTVGAWMKLPVIKEDTGNLREVFRQDPQRVVNYNKNDVKLTRSIGRTYWANYTALAEEHGAPLNLLFRATPNFHVTTIAGRTFQNETVRIVSDGKNYDRFRHVYTDPSCPIRNGKKKPVTGAHVDIYKTGFFKPIFKIDFASLYPSIIIALGLGPDNTRLLGFEEHGPFRCEVQGTKRIYSFPDHGWKKNIIIEVDGYSEFATAIKNVLIRRLTIKKQAKDEEKKNGKTPLYYELKARENALKVTLNSLYGVQAGASSRYASLAVGMAITACARFLIRETETYLGDLKIETDTDGVYISGDPGEEKTNDYLDGVARSKLQVENRMTVLGKESQVLKVEVDSYAAGYFSKRKLYILWKKDGDKLKTEKHGSGFKSASAPGCFDKTLDKLCEFIYNEDRKGAATHLRDAINLTGFKDDDFIMRVKAGDEDEYEGENPVGLQLIRSFEQHFKRTPPQGETIEYLKTSFGYEVVTPETMQRIDKKHYKELLVDLAARVDIAPDGRKQASLMEM